MARDLVTENPVYDSASDVDIHGLVVSRQFQVLAPSEADAKVYLFEDFGIPPNGVGAVYVNSQGEIPDAYCLSQKINCAGSGPIGAGAVGLWSMTVLYSRKPIGGRLGPQVGKPAIWSQEYGHEQSHEDIDITGRVIMNAVEETFANIEPAERTSIILVADFYRIGKFGGIEAVQNVFLPYLDNINLDDFRGFAADSLKVLAPVIYEESGGLFRCQMRFQYRLPKPVPPGVGLLMWEGATGHSPVPGVTNIDGKVGGWIEVKLNVGKRRVLDGSQSDPNKRYTRIIIDGAPVVDDVLADETGNWTNANTAVALINRKYNRLDFTKIPIP